MNTISADEYEYFNAYAGKKCNPRRGRNKHRKGPFTPKRIEKGFSGTERDFMNTIW